MAFFGYFLSPRKESIPSETKRKNKETPTVGVEPRSYTQVSGGRSVGGDAHAVERSGTSTLGVHRPAVSPPHPLRCSVGADDPVRPKTPRSGVIPSQCSHWRGNPYPAPAGAEHPPPVGVSKEGGPQPSLFGRFKERGFLRGEGNRNPFPLEWRSLDTFFRQGKKVSRRRQKEKTKKRQRSGQNPSPTTV